MTFESDQRTVPGCRHPEQAVIVQPDGPWDQDDFMAEDQGVRRAEIVIIDGEPVGSRHFRMLVELSAGGGQPPT